MNAEMINIFVADANQRIRLFFSFFGYLGHAYQITMFIIDADAILRTMHIDCSSLM